MGSTKALPNKDFQHFSTTLDPKTKSSLVKNMPLAPKGKDRFSTTIFSGATVDGRNPAPVFSTCKAQKKSWDIYHMKWCKISYINSLSVLVCYNPNYLYLYLYMAIYIRGYKL